jgi:Uma2 family endonuclease
MVIVAHHHPAVTADEFFAMADRLPRHAQLIAGEVVVNSPTFGHQYIVGELFAHLREWCRSRPGRGTCGFHVDAPVDVHNVYCPDVWWCRPHRAPRPGDTRLTGLPDLAVEVLSPSTRHHDLGTKRRTYGQLGLPELWIVDPLDLDAVTARLLRRGAPGVAGFDIVERVEAGGVLTSPQLDGFSVALHELLDAG